MGAESLASELDREYTEPTLREPMGDFYPVAGRYLYGEVTAVDTTNKIVTATGPGGGSFSGEYTAPAPEVGARWRFVRTVSGDYIPDGPTNG